MDTLGSRRVLGIVYGDMFEIEIELEAQGKLRHEQQILDALDWALVDLRRVRC